MISQSTAITTITITTTIAKKMPMIILSFTNKEENVENGIIGYEHEEYDEIIITTCLI